MGEKNTVTASADIKEVIFLTESELAQRWQISAKTLRNARSRGVGVPHTKIIGAIRYLLSDVEHYERRNRRFGTGRLVPHV